MYTINHCIQFTHPRLTQISRTRSADPGATLHTIDIARPCDGSQKSHHRSDHHLAGLFSWKSRRGRSAGKVTAFWKNNGTKLDKKTFVAYKTGKPGRGEWRNLVNENHTGVAGNEIKQPVQNASKWTEMRMRKWLKCKRTDQCGIYKGTKVPSICFLRSDCCH